MKKAFTLIELLTVIAITAVMLTLIVLPIFQSFQITRTAQAFSDAQDKGRLLVDTLGREVGNAVSVRNLGSTVAQVPGLPDTILPYTKMDLILPAQGDPSDKVNGAYRDPITGKGDPTRTRPKGDIRLPVAPGQTYTRWWVGLNDPTQPYNEPYTGLLMARNARRDNLFVLRRAEVQPFLYRARKDGAANSMAWRPNLDFFRSDDKDPYNTAAEFDTRIVDLDDPYFFVANGSDPTKNARVANWAKASVVQTEISRYDMIRPAVKGSPPQLDTAAPVRVLPLVQFRPTRVSATAAGASVAARPGESVEGLDTIGPDTYTTQRGLWANAIVRYYPKGFVPLTATGLFEIATVDAMGGVTISAGGSSGNGLDGIRDYPNNYALFDLRQYEQLLAKGDVYPFTRAALSAGGTDTLPGYPGTPWMNVEEQRRTFAPFRVLTATGRVVTSFAVDEVGDPTFSPRLPVNLPYVVADDDYAVSPSTAASTDTGLATAPLSPETGTYDPNRAFNRLWNAYPGLQGQLQRFVDLRMVKTADEMYTPLYPNALANRVTGFAFDNAQGGTTNRVRIVPGSDEVYGPDQNPGPNYGVIVRYTRSTGNPGLNQYRLNYVDRPEPTNGAGQIDYSVLGLELPTADLTDFKPKVYDGTNVVSAAIQARFKAGYLQLCSDPTVPIPGRVAGDPNRTGRVTVRYRFQFTGAGDTFAVDHDTREVLQILLTIKNYPQASVPNAQTVTLKSTATLRNALR